MNVLILDYKNDRVMLIDLIKDEIISNWHYPKHMSQNNKLYMECRVSREYKSNNCINLIIYK